MNGQHAPGFTLIEIMVALGIIAITLGAIVENTTASSKNAAYLRDKTIAGWVAMNQLALVRAKREWTSVSNKKGEVEMAGRDWIWKMQIKKTPNVNIRELIVDVYTDDDDGQSLVTMTGYLGNL